MKRRAKPKAGGVAADDNGPDEPSTSYRPMGAALTLEEIKADELTEVAKENWSNEVRAAQPPPPFRPDLVEKIYGTELGGSPAPQRLKRVMLLEISQYLENYLWPHFDADTASDAHVMSILVMVNEKFRENVPAWSSFSVRAQALPALFERILALRAPATGPGGRPWHTHERVTYLVFAIHAFQSLENEAVRRQVLRLVSLPLWHALSRGRLQLELQTHDVLVKHWRSLAKKEARAAKEAGEAHVPVAQRAEAAYIPSLLTEFLDVLRAIVPEALEADAATEGALLDRQKLLFCERFLEFAVDLLSQLPTRRFVRTLLDDRALLVKCRLSGLFKHHQGRLFRQLVDLLHFYLAFPIDDHTGEPLSDAAVTARHYARLVQLQRLLFRHHPALRDLALANCGTLQRREVLMPALVALPEEELRLLAVRQLRLLAEDDPWADDKGFVAEVVMAAYEKRRAQTEIINTMPLYPTEKLLWDENQVPNVQYTGESCLALPKLNLQFLTAHDYLLRNFSLFRLEATYEIREDIADVLARVGATWDEDDEDKVVFRGWARMALPIDSFSVVEVRKPNVGEAKPAAVTAEIVINPGRLRGDVRAEWDEAKQHDVLFLLTLRPPAAHMLAAARADGKQPSPAELYGLIAVRGCEVIEVKDEEGRLMNDFTGRVKREEWQPPAGLKRTLVVALDTAQYQLDMEAMQASGSEDAYSSFNLLVRRKPKENNFKAVLESIRDLMNEETVMPAWLHDIFLGYGDPAAARYTNLPDTLQTIDFKDTFLDAAHLRASFPGHQVEFTQTCMRGVAHGGAGEANGAAAMEVDRDGEGQPRPPYRVTFPLAAPAPAPTVKPGKGGKRKAADAEAVNGAVEAAPTGPLQLVVEPYRPPDPGPYPQDKPPENTVRFTPVQVEAIRAGVQPGLTMVVGPPGTGKTDTAVQIMHVLYHNCPSQRTLLITHSNQALNDLFEKILQRDVPARYLLRLGMGEQDLATTSDFSRVGRVNAMLARRLELLAEVERLAKQLAVVEDVSYTCETAAHFWLLHVLARWEKFVTEVERRRTPECVQDLFPFKAYFADAPGGLFKGRSYAADLERARGCWRHLRTMFQELEECRAFELLKGQADRVNYLMTKQAKIVAMTCTHAALKRREFLELGFKFDNLLMEESAQILEIETFIPMLLQRQDDGVARLKRVVLIGDHHQLPPVVKNMAFQKFSHLDQSLFTRFVRLGTPYIQLNAQGRARPSLAKLYNWRYHQLGDLPNVTEGVAFLRANPGFALDFQFVDVPDYQGQGESAPVPHFYQNLGEAEMVVSVYMYMRLRGYPAAQISILSPYNGQVALLRDVIERRCAQHPAFGRPHKVATVDKYQGQQNEYVLLSLTRTRAVGHIRDVRRLVVAMSRARLGLYVFGRAALFANCYELQPTFTQLLSRPTQLLLHPVETVAECQRAVGDPGRPLAVAGVEAMGALVHAMTREWELQTHAAAVAARAAVPPPVPPPRVPEKAAPAAAPTSGSAASAGAEAVAGAAAAARLAESAAGEAAAGGARGEKPAGGIGEVVDLVPNLDKQR